MIDDSEALRREFLRRELAKRDYGKYLSYVHGKAWRTTKMSTLIATTVQRFLETDTGNAYDILVIETPPQHGKLCADSTPVPTPKGWIRHGDLQIGDEVFSPGGEPIKVLNTMNEGQIADYLVSFSDGEQIKTHGAHEWVVYDGNRKRRQRVVETQELYASKLYYGEKGKRGNRYRFQVDHNVPVTYPEAEQPIDPYVFGLWLGDGSTTKPAITYNPADQAVIDECVKRGYELSTEYVHKDTGVPTAYFYGSELYKALKSLGLGYEGCRAKYVPECYRVASKEQRLELLAGFIDSDGYTYPKNGRVTLVNTNRDIIEGLAEVCRSLGFSVSVSGTEPKISSSGIEGRLTSWQLCFNPTLPIPVKVERHKLVTTQFLLRRRAIVSVEKCEPEKGKCITVEGGVYLVGTHFVPTHNSMTITETLPSWYLGNHPEHRVIIASYNEDFAEKFCRRNKEKLRTAGVNVFGIGVGAVDRAQEFELNNGKGRLISRGIMSGITGNPANLVIIDDPIKNMEEADSPTRRDKIWEEWQASIKSRLAAHGKVIVIMTPWHEDDFAARLLANEPNSTLLRLPVEAEENDPLGREPGEPLCPELGKDARWLEDYKASYMNDPRGGQRSWTALYQCSPRVESGNLVRRDWWKFYDPKETRMYGTELISVDAAFKSTDKSDFVSIQVWGKHKNDYYLRYCMNKRLDFPETLQAIRTVKALYPRAATVLIEDKANGSAIISTLQHEMFTVPVNPQGGKVARVNAVSAAIESGHVYLPDPSQAAWVTDFIDQFTAFPNGAHDDMVDSATQALHRMLYNNGEYEAPVVPETELAAREEERRFNDPDVMFSPYGSNTFGF